MIEAPPPLSTSISKNRSRPRARTARWTVSISNPHGLASPLGCAGSPAFVVDLDRSAQYRQVSVGSGVSHVCNYASLPRHLGTN